MDFHVSLSLDVATFGLSHSQFKSIKSHQIICVSDDTCNPVLTGSKPLWLKTSASKKMSTNQQPFLSSSTQKRTKSSSRMEKLSTLTGVDAINHFSNGQIILEHSIFYFSSVHYFIYGKTCCNCTVPTELSVFICIQGYHY